MEGLILSPAEQQLFSEWFSSCDVENTGKVVPARAFDLFATSQLAKETLQQISILCGATRLGHFGRSQFYIALKLIAAVQSGLPVRLESLNSGMEVPLPKLQQSKGDQDKKRAQFSNPAFNQNINEDYQPLDKQNERPNAAQQPQPQQVSLPPPPSKENILTGQVVFRQRSGSAASTSSNSSSASSPASSAHSSPPDSPHMLHRSLEKQRSLPIMGVHSQGVQNEAFEEGSFKERGWASFDTETDELVPVEPNEQWRAQSPEASQPASTSQQQPQTPQQPQQQQSGVVSPKMMAMQQSVAVHQTRVVQPQSQQPQTPGAGLHQAELVQQPQQPYQQPQQQPGIPLTPSQTALAQQQAMLQQQQSQQQPQQMMSQTANQQQIFQGAVGLQHVHLVEHTAATHHHSHTHEHCNEDVWRISEEQQEYYVNQFKILQPDIKGVIQGSTAREYFQKSKLPLQELSQIWQLSDVNKDGALSLEEFFTAMHLVVLRKHDIPLPDVLPPCLVPKMGSPETEDPFSSAPCPTTPTKPVSPAAAVTSPVQWTEQQQQQQLLQQQQQAQQQAQQPLQQQQLGGDQWATFSDHGSPPVLPSSPSSQSPANFDFASISPDPDGRIVQPIPLRISPDGQPLPPEYCDNKDSLRPRTFSDPGTGGGIPCDDNQNDLPLSPGGKQRSLTDADTAAPQTRDTTTSPQNTDSQKPAKLPPPPAKDRRSKSVSTADVGSWKLYKDVSSAEKFVPPPPRPSIPPRVGAQAGGVAKVTAQQSETRKAKGTKHGSGDHPDGSVQDFADFSQFETMTADSPKAGRSPDPSVHRRAKSLDYRKIKSLEDCKPPPPPRPTEPAKASPERVDDSSHETRAQHTKRRAPSPPSISKGRHLSGDELQSESKEDFSKERKRHASAPPVPVTHPSGPRDKKTIKASIRNTKDRNTTLLRLNNELQQELKEIMEERVDLELQIEHLKPFKK